MSIISVVMMMIDHRQHHLESIRSIFSVIVYPIQYLVNVPTSAGDWVGENLSSRETLLLENKKLKDERILLRASQLKLSALKVENNRLRELLQSSRKVGENVLIGELLAVDLEPFTKQIVINKGTNDGAFLGQPLLDADGVMGQIVHVGPFSSTAMMITDPNHAIPVQVNRNGLRAILVGTGAPDVLEVPFLANSTDIVVGDLLTSSGLGGRFPPDYPVATVVSVKKDQTKPYAVITATPTAQLERSREVLLVWRTQEGRPKVSAPMGSGGEAPASSATELESSAMPTIPASPNSIILDAPIEDETVPPEPPVPNINIPVDEAVTPEESASSPPSTVTPTKVVVPSVVTPVEATAAETKTNSKAKSTASASKPVPESMPKPVSKPSVSKALSNVKPRSVPLSEQPMPIEEDFVAPSSPNDLPIDEQETDEGPR